MSGRLERDAWARQHRVGREISEWSRRVSANLYPSEAASLSPEAQQIKEFVEALLALNSWRVTKSDGATVDFLLWRHHSYVTTLSVLGGLEAKEGHSQTWNLSSIARSDGIRDCLVSSGNPVAIRKWLSDKGLQDRWPFKTVSSLENWPLERIRAELLKQQLGHVWPKQAMRVIAFALLRDNVVREVDFEQLCKMSSTQIRKQARLLGDTLELEAAKPERTNRGPKRQATSIQRETQPVDRKFERWLTAGKPWIRGAQVEGAEFSTFLAGLHDAGRRWPTANGSRAPEPRDPDWLDEILARAEDAAPLLRFAPAWPTTFTDHKHLITIAVVDKTLVGWVEIGHSKTLVSIDLETWEPKSRGAQKQLDVAVGLAIGWYLDSCICLRKKSHPHFRFERSRSGPRGITRISNEIVLPTPRFRTDFESVRRGSRQPPRAHRVRGHVRELSDLRSPSKSARSNAPYYIRRHLKPNETFVQSHSRGKGEKSRAIAVYLSKYSTLADALGSL